MNLTNVVTQIIEPERAGWCVCGKREGKECGRVTCVQRKTETALPPGAPHLLPPTGRRTPRRPASD